MSSKYYRLQGLHWNNIQVDHPNLPINGRYPNKSAVVIRVPDPALCIVNKTELCFKTVYVAQISVLAMPPVDKSRKFVLVVRQRSDIFEHDKSLATESEARGQKPPERGLRTCPSGPYYVVEKELNYDRRVRRQLIAAAEQFFREYRLGFGTLDGHKGGISGFMTKVEYYPKEFLCKGDDQSSWQSPEYRLHMDLLKVQEKAEAMQAKARSHAA